MSEICEYCEDQGYWDCGDGNLCGGANDPCEDRCHDVAVWVKPDGDCCTAKLWTAGTPPPGAGWKRWGKVEIRVQTFMLDEKCKVRVFVPKPDCAVEEGGKKA